MQYIFRGCTISKLKYSDMHNAKALGLMTLLVALGAFAPALAAQLLLRFALPYIHHLGTLLFLAYAALFVSLALLPLGAAWVARQGRVRPPLPGLRPALMLEAVALSLLWYFMLNPFPAEPLLANAQYLPLLLLGGALFLSWLFFLFLMRKIV